MQQLCNNRITHFLFKKARLPRSQIPATVPYHRRLLLLLLQYCQYQYLQYLQYLQTTRPAAAVWLSGWLY